MSKWLIIGIIAVVLGVWGSGARADSVVRKDSRTLIEGDTKQHVISCQRWAALLVGANMGGMENFVAYINANPNKFNGTDITFLKHEIAPIAVELSTSKITYAEAMHICGAALKV